MTVYLDRTDRPEWFAIDARHPAAIAFLRKHISLFGSRRVNGKISLVIEAGRVDGFVEFCHKSGIETDLES